MGTFLDMPIATSAIDSSGEELSIANTDISDFIEGRAFANWEHAPDKGSDNIVGFFRYAKKILKESDCSTDRQRKFWNQLQHPFIYGICELFDDEGHAGALAVAAMVRYFVNRGMSVRVGASIEGITLDRTGFKLNRAIGRNVAITLKPCNKECWVDMASESDLRDVIAKSEAIESSGIETVEMDIQGLSKMEIPIADLLSDIYREAILLNKTLTGGGGDSAPSGLTGGAALAREDVGHTNRIRAAIRDWDGKKSIREVVKSALPEVGDAFIDHFVQIAEELSLQKREAIRVGSETSGGQPDARQKLLLEGLSISPKLQRQTSINDIGDTAVVNQIAPSQDGSCPSDKALAYYAAAHNVFGLSNHVPVSARIDMNGSRYLATHRDDKSQLPISTEMYQQARNNHRKDGSLHKLAILDTILGVPSRNQLNTLINSQGKLEHIDNASAFSDDSSNMPYRDLEKDIMPHDVYQWLLQIDPKALAQHLAANNIAPDKIRQSLYALRYAQKRGATLPFGEMWYNMHGGQ
jgi:hypothetical protein